MSEINLKIKKEANFPEYAEKLYLELEEMIKNRNITTVNIVNICLSLMMIVETFPNLNGPKKKLIVLETLEKLVKQQIEDKNEADSLILIIKLTLPSVIDTFVGLDKNKIKIQSKKLFYNCCR
jgi:hypothetical protein